MQPSSAFLFDMIEQEAAAGILFGLLCAVLQHHHLRRDARPIFDLSVQVHELRRLDCFPHAFRPKR
jgi:hypothetical protein